MTTPVLTDNSSTDRPAVSGLALWTLRGLALFGLALALFLTGAHLLMKFKVASTTVPFCSVLPWFDCNTVLNSEWSTVFGVPVSGLAAGVYALVLLLLCVPLGRVDRGFAGRVWFLLSIFGVMISGAAAWFIYLQTARLGHLCSYCMTEHAVGITLSLLIWLHALSAGALKAHRTPLTLVAGLVPVGMLIFSQHLDEQDYAAQQKPIVGQIDSMGNYREPVPSGAGVELRGGWVVLDPRAHLMVGSLRATRFIVEAVDYTCPRCRYLHGKMRVARPMMGPDYAVIVLTNPLSHHCNLALDSTEERHRDACNLARLAHAVWVVDGRKFAEFHDWLFENQEEMTAVRAHREAVRLVGEAALEDVLKSEAPEQLIKRDLEIARLLDVHQLPGLFVGNIRFNAIPEEPKVLAELLVRAFNSPAEQPKRE